MEYTAESSKRTREDCYEQGTGNRFVQKKSAEIYGRRAACRVRRPFVAACFVGLCRHGGRSQGVGRLLFTRAVAEAIHAAVGGDIVELQPVTPYPEAYRATTDQAKQELASGYKPPLKHRIGHIEAYDVVFVGSPNWWGTVAGPVRTFLSEYDLAGKRIAPFITHEGSALGRSVADIKAFCPKAVVLDGLAVRGSRAASAQGEVAAWLRKIGMGK